MSTDDRMETITDPAEIRATDEPDERGDFPCCATPAPVGAGLDLDAMARRYSTATDDEVIYEMYPALEAEVRRLTSHADGLSENLGGDLIAWAARAESAEAEVVTLRDTLARRTDSHTQLVRENETLRAKVAAVEAVHVRCGEGVCNAGPKPEICHECGVAWPCPTFAALATTGEGQ
jgi:hypothetical protein